jgi:hypothetical protein
MRWFDARVSFTTGVKLLGNLLYNISNCAAFEVY